MDNEIHGAVLFAESSTIDLAALERELDHNLLRLYPGLHQDGIRVHVVTPERMPDRVLDSLSKVLPNFYGDVEDSLFGTFRSAAYLTADPNGYFTMRKVLFGIYSQTEALGLTMATFKRGGSVKFGPTAVAPDHRHMGLARALRDVVESVLQQVEGIRKFYLTVNTKNHPALLFNLDRGFRVEGSLRDQYQDKSNELILSRDASSPIPRHIIENMELATADAGGIPDVDVWENASVEELRGLMQPTLLKYYATGSESFYRHLVASSQAGIRDYAAKSKVVFRARQGDAITGLAVCAPKRGGSVKIAPLIALDRAAIPALLDRILIFSAQHDMKKIYATIPLAERGIVKQLLESGLDLEATLRAPYQTGQDFVVLSRKIEQ